MDAKICNRKGKPIRHVNQICESDKVVLFHNKYIFYLRYINPLNGTSRPFYYVVIYLLYS